jgi:hypothetical protein
MPSFRRRLAQRYLHLVPRRLRPKPATKPKAAKAKRKRPPTDAAAESRQAREALLRGLERGREIDHAIVAQVRALIAAGRPDTARAVAEGLRRREETAALGHLTGGIVAYREGYGELALDELRRVPRPLRLTYAAADYVRSGLAIDREATLAEVRALAAEDPPGVSARTWFQILAPVFGIGAQDVAREVFAVFERHVREDPRRWRDGDRQVEWMRPWIAADSESPTAPSPGRRTFAIVDYGHPAPTARPPTSATTSRRSPRSGTSCATRTSGCTAPSRCSACSPTCASARGRSSVAPRSMPTSR